MLLRKKALAIFSAFFIIIAPAALAVSPRLLGAVPEVSLPDGLPAAANSNDAHHVDERCDNERESRRRFAVQLATRGCNLAQRRKYALALADFESAARVCPECPRLDYARALCLEKLRRQDEAVRAYREAIAREPEYADAQYHLGRLLLEMEQLDAAEESFSQAIKIAPTDAQNYSARAAVWNKKHKYNRAIEDLDEAIRLDPKIAERYVARAQLKSLLGRHEEARQDCDMAVERAPRKLGIRLYRALLSLSISNEHMVQKTEKH